jgi:twitching motility two-component system response regulator PilH
MPKTVLAVDDDPDILSATETVLQEHGYTPLLAQDGEAALRILEKQAPDVVILDILMPKQSGIKIYQMLKTDGPLRHIPVIVHSGIPRRTFLRSQEALIAFGDNPVPEPEAYLEKPIEPEELITAISKLFG